MIPISFEYVDTSYELGYLLLDHLGRRFYDRVY